MADDERIAELEQEVAQLKGRLEAQSAKMNRIVELLCEDVGEFGELDVAAEEPLLSRLDGHDDRLDKIQDDAARAIVNARARTADGGESKTKVQIAEEIARNEVVRRAAKNPSQDSATVKATKVQDLAKPQHELRYQTVKDALSNLKEEWRELWVRNDPKELELRREKVTRELTAVVDEDLAEVDATKRLISEEVGGRGSA